MTEQPIYELTFPEPGFLIQTRMWHYSQLSPNEIETLKITENCYWVEMMSLTGIETFELYLGEDAEWLAKPTDATEKKIIEMIGDKIESITL